MSEDRCIECGEPATDEGSPYCLTCKGGTTPMLVKAPTTPAEKLPKIERELDALAMAMYGRTRTDSIKDNLCVLCGDTVAFLRDEKSAREYTLSGMCQPCQDDLFKDQS